MTDATRYAWSLVDISLRLRSTVFIPASLPFEESKKIVFLAELNGLSLWSTDIGNTYLKSNTQENIYIVAGPELDCVGLQGYTLIVVKALDGLN
jgi:hypothetical protein